MKHVSLVKLIAALCIANVYIFCCAVTGTVNSIAEEPTTSDDNQTSDNVVNNQGGTVDFIGVDDVIDNGNLGGNNTSNVTIENLGFTKPTFVQKPISSSYLPTSSVKELTEKAEESSASSSESVPDVIGTAPISSSESKPVESSSSSTSSSNSSSSTSTSSSTSNTTSTRSLSSTVSSSSTSSSSSSTSSDPDIPAVPATPTTPGGNPADEILRVSDNYVEVSGNAVDIITQIVENEIGSTFAPEAIKAQAVTAYTYVKYHNLHGNAPFCYLKESTNNSVRTLVESVIGECIYYDDELIQAVYFASSAGCTLASKDVWGGDLPYLQSVYCELDEQYDPNYGRKKTFSADDIKQRVYNNANIALSGDPANWFTIENRISGKWVNEITIGGQNYFIDKDGDTLKATGRRFREIIMEYDIRSSAFDIEYNESTQEFTITTYGYGHGVGLSQNGANNLAKYWGWDYKKILTFYFQGTEVY
ncbi:MAG: SpoIID/LytB domain-containing protein [Oscillospiraceae bacterium]|nr:SpoIID/LytB domain-containing protein [Oscillospiraceae bacterium]